MNTFDIPVALVIFNRPDCTAKTIQRIREIQPSHLFIIADGPRANKRGEARRCEETRKVAENAVDWPCRIVKDYATQNMGCGKRLPSGLSNLFKQVDRAIILEDDIVPHPSFFPFCQAMLEKYESEERVMQISAYNRFQQRPSSNLDYFFSRFSDIWGWATWKKSWEHFDAFDMETWRTLRTNDRFIEACYSRREAEMRRFCLDQIFSGKLSAWAMRWDTAKLLNAGLGIIPARNLTLNIGFGVEASHTVNPFNPHRFKKVYGIAPPYRGPQNIHSDTHFDHRYNQRMFPKNIISEKLRTGLLKLTGKS